VVEDINTQRLQEQVDNAEKTRALQVQLDKIKRIIDRGFLYTFIAGVIGSFCYWVLLALMLLGILPENPILIPIMGMSVFCGCVGFCSYYVLNAKAEYKKLLEQLQQTHNIPK
jgi:hypothetical protein